MPRTPKLRAVLFRAKAPGAITQGALVTSEEVEPYVKHLLDSGQADAQSIVIMAGEVMTATIEPPRMQEAVVMIGKRPGRPLKKQAAPPPPKPKKVKEPKKPKAEPTPSNGTLFQSPGGTAV